MNRSSGQHGKRNPLRALGVCCGGLALSVAFSLHGAAQETTEFERLLQSNFAPGHSAPADQKVATTQRIETEGEDEFLEAIENEDEFNRIADFFMERSLV